MSLKAGDECIDSIFLSFITAYTHYTWSSSALIPDMPTLFFQSSSRSLLTQLPIYKVNGTHCYPASFCSSSCWVHLVCNRLSSLKALLRALTPNPPKWRCCKTLQHFWINTRDGPFIIITSDSRFPTCEPISWKNILCPQQILI